MNRDPEVQAMVQLIDSKLGIGSEADFLILSHMSETASFLNSESRKATTFVYPSFPSKFTALNTLFRMSLASFSGRLCETLCRNGRCHRMVHNRDGFVCANMHPFSYCCVDNSRRAWHQSGRLRHKSARSSERTCDTISCF